MLRAVTFGCLLFLDSAWITFGDSPITTQDNFHLEQFLGKWFEVAVVSTCPYFMQRKLGNPFIVVQELQQKTSEGNVTVTATTFRNESCKRASTNYSLTETPGRFFYHIQKFAADVDVYVVGTNYVEYATMVLVSTEKPSGKTTIIIKLYSRTKDVSTVILGDFKMLVRQQGIDDQAIIMNQDKGQCDEMTEPTV